MLNKRASTWQNNSAAKKMSDYNKNLKKVYITALDNFGNFGNFGKKFIFVMLAVDSLAMNVLGTNQ